MESLDVEGQVLTVLGAARSDDLLSPLQTLLGRLFAARDVDVLLPNYQLNALRSVRGRAADPDTARPVRLDLSTTLAGRCFVEQRAVTQSADDGGVSVCVPVGARGERVGVLSLRLDASDQDAQTGLRRAADALAYSLLAAARQTDALACATRSQRLTLAAELQWQLLPGQECRAEEYELAGHLEPAYRVQADSFDWSHDGPRLSLSVTDGAHQHPGTSLLPTLTVTALRNARRAGLDLADQAFLANQAVFAHHQGREDIGALLVALDVDTGRVDAVRAGSPRLFVVRGSRVVEPPLTEQDPLGMFEETDYTTETVDLEPGDRLVLVTDGVHATASPGQEEYADTRLVGLLERTHDDHATRVLRAVIDDLYDHRGSDELDDDAVILVVDFTGPTSA